MYSVAYTVYCLASVFSMVSAYQPSSVVCFYFRALGKQIKCYHYTPPPSFFLTILTRPPIFFLAQIHSLYDADRSSSCCPHTFTCRLHTITYHLHTFAFCHRTFACRPREGWKILLKSCIFQDSAGKKINKIPPNFF